MVEVLLKYGANPLQDYEKGQAAVTYVNKLADDKPQIENFKIIRDLINEHVQQNKMNITPILGDFFNNKNDHIFTNEKINYKKNNK